MVRTGNAVDVKEQIATEGATDLEIFANVSERPMSGRFIGVIRACSRPS